MTTQSATITGKRQLTIPIDIYNYLGFRQGEKVLITPEKDHFRVQSYQALLDSLAGSVKVPKKYQNLTPDQAIEKAKTIHFAQKYGIR